MVASSSPSPAPRPIHPRSSHTVPVHPTTASSAGATGTTLSRSARASLTPVRVPLADSIRDLALRLGPRATPCHPVDLRGLLRPVRQAFADHRALTEGDDGLYAELVCDAPRLARTVDGLVAEHRTIDVAMERLISGTEVGADAEVLRRDALVVLDGLARHRQRDADLVYEAYSTDIGGE
jgi:hypothetical protein